ncbi:MAG: hypothetical protein WD469_08315 [Paenibacillaceae bacterium]
MLSYRPEESNFNSKHTVRLKFLWGQASAEVITTMGGNICGGDVIQFFGGIETGISAPSDNEINQKHCVFDPEDTERNYREVEAITVYHPQKGSFRLDLEEAQRYLVSIEIIDYKANEEE